MTATFPGRALAALASLLIACLLSTPLAAATTIAARPCSSAALLGCPRSVAIAHASDTEAAEPEGELEEGSEEATAAEAGAEAEEDESEESGLSSEHAHSGEVSLSDPRLTASATIALEHHHPLVSAIGFSFTLSTHTKVRVTLLGQITTHGHTRWVALPEDSLSLNAKQGRAVYELTGHNRLTPGRYRLTLDPSGGHARAIYLDAGR